MARIKETGKPRYEVPGKKTGRSKSNPGGARVKRSTFLNILRKPARPEPAPTVEARERPKVVFEMGASHNGVMRKRPGQDQWEPVKLGRGVGASSIGGVDVVPTMTAVRSQGGSQEGSQDVLHGNSAVNARIRDSRSWTFFEYHKHAYINIAPTNEVERILKLQREVAAEKGWNIKDLADQYFCDILSRAVGEDAEPPIIFVNINEAWDNEDAQRLVHGLQKIIPGAEVHGIDECFSSLIGALSRELATTAHPIYLVYADCGHSTMERCAVTVNPEEPRFVIHKGSWETVKWGAAVIDMAVVDELRAINKEAGEGDIDKGVWETLQYINEHVKPDTSLDFPPRSGFTESSWGRVLRVTRSAEKRLHTEWVDLIIQLIRKTYVAGADNRLLLTGRASLSRMYIEQIKDALDVEFPGVQLLQKVEERTYVQLGLACMADDSKLLSVDTAPLSLWMRSDPDASGDDNASAERDDSQDDGESQREAVRICRQGQALTPKTASESDRNPSHPIHFELSCKHGRPEIDLSVFGTPPTLSDEDVIVRRGNSDEGDESHECLVFSQPDKLTRFGDFCEELPMQNERADGIYHVYVFSRITRVGITLFAVFAEDGHKIPLLESQSINLVLQNVSLSSTWKSHNGVRMSVVWLGQVARPEFLTGNSGGDSVLKSRDKNIGSQGGSASKPKDHNRRNKRKRMDDELVL